MKTQIASLLMLAGAAWEWMRQQSQSLPGNPLHAKPKPAQPVANPLPVEDLPSPDIWEPEQQPTRSDYWPGLSFPEAEPEPVEKPKTGWTLPPAAGPYVGHILNAEQKYKIPPGMLGRLLYQESHFRQDIITGKLKSSAGAIGIAQIVPKWHPGVDPYDPYASIDYAGKYLRQLYNQFDDWRLALAAYNWGPGNLKKHGWENRPQETRRYVKDITNEIGYV